MSWNRIELWKDYWLIVIGGTSAVKASKSIYPSLDIRISAAEYVRKPLQHAELHIVVRAKAHYLLYKVFTAAYIVCNRLLSERNDAACKELSSRFRQFRRMLELLAESRNRGIDIGRFDLIDFDNYDQIYKQLGISSDGKTE